MLQRAGCAFGSITWYTKGLREVLLAACAQTEDALAYAAPAALADRFKMQAIVGQCPAAISYATPEIRANRCVSKNSEFGIPDFSGTH